MRCRTRARTRLTTMRLSDARLRRKQTKLIYTNHQPPPWLTEDDNPAFGQLLGGSIRPNVGTPEVVDKKYMP
jgi:hypothetical protein